MAICTICGLVTEYLKQHMSNHGDERNCACDKCEKVCQGYKQMMNHKKSHMTWNCTNCGNDALECMEKNFQEVMIHFYKKHNLSKTGEGPGGKFNGFQSSLSSEKTP